MCLHQIIKDAVVVVGTAAAAAAFGFANQATTTVCAFVPVAKV